jgi:hypothetical protein
MPHSAKSSDFVINAVGVPANTSRNFHGPQSCKGVTCVMQRAHPFNK